MGAAVKAKVKEPKRASITFAFFHLGLFTLPPNPVNAWSG